MQCHIYVDTYYLTQNVIYMSTYNVMSLLSKLWETCCFVPAACANVLSAYVHTSAHTDGRAESGNEENA
jgi:hypothetical protein